MSGYEQVETFEPVEGELISDRPEEGFPDTPEGRLEYTQSIRAMIINQLCTGGKIPTNDKDQMAMLKDALSGIDSQELNKKKIENKKEENANVNSIAKILESVSKEVSRNTNGAGLAPGMSTRGPRDPKLFNRDIRNDFNVDSQELELVRREESSEDFFNRMEEERGTR